MNAVSSDDIPDRMQARGVVEELTSKVRGDVLTPGTPEYEHRRPIWNGMFDEETPTAIVRCADGYKSTLRCRAVRTRPRQGHTELLG